MADPLTEIVKLLQPRAVFANPITGKGEWAVRYSAYGRPSFCILLAGQCLLAVDGHAPVTLGAGDFVLLPATPPFTLSSFGPAPVVHLDPHSEPGAGERRHGDLLGEPDMRSLGGAFLFDGGDPRLLVSMLPGVVHVKGSQRLAQLVHMVGEEHEAPKPGSEFVLSHLVGMLLIEAMRWTTAGQQAPPGLLRGLGDARLAPALQQLHADVARGWTVGELAARSALSRSAFFDRFTRTVGATPMGHLLTWRMEVAKGLLREGRLAVADIAERVGYGSTSAFSVAFSRHVGQSPSQHARAWAEARAS